MPSSDHRAGHSGRIASWRRHQPGAGQEWRQEYEALRCVDRNGIAAGDIAIGVRSCVYSRAVDGDRLRDSELSEAARIDAALLISPPMKVWASAPANVRQGEVSVHKLLSFPLCEIHV